MKIYSVNQLMRNECMQFDQGVQMGLAIYSATNGNICEGCAKNMGSRLTCETLIALQKEDQSERINSLESEKRNYETVRQEAVRRGVSIKQVRTERRG